MEARRKCDTCSVRHLGICAALSKEEFDGLNQIARIRRLSAGQRIISDQIASDSFAIIVEGTVKLAKVLPDGRQQIVGLLFPSDFVGRPFTKRGTCHAETATDVQLCSFPAASFEALMHRFPGIEHRLFLNALDELDAAQEWMLLLGRKTAREKVASLLLMIARRSGPSIGREIDRSAVIRFKLSLSRADFADFLGLRLETVSRQLGALKSQGIIGLTSHRGISILSVAKLEAAATNSIA